MRPLALALLALGALAAGPAAAADAPPPSPVPPVAPAGGAGRGPAAAPRPRVTVDREAHDFGAVAQQGEYTTTFTFRNEGDAPLTFGAVRGDCGCTRSEVSAKEVPPGGTATLTVAFRTFTFVGPQTKHVQVGTNDPDRPTVDLTVRVDVSAGIVVEPANFFFPPVLAGASPTASLRVQYREGVGRPFHVLGVEPAALAPAGTAVAFDVKPFDAAPWHGFEITMRFEKPPPVGPVNGSALIRTDDPRASRIQALVGGLVSGRVRIGLVKPSFGLVTPGKGAHLQIPVRPFDDTVDLGEVTATSRKGRVQASVERDPRNPKAWILHLKVPPDAPPGAIDDVVEVRTSVRGEEVTDLPVTGSVLEKP